MLKDKLYVDLYTYTILLKQQTNANSDNFKIAVAGLHQALKDFQLIANKMKSEREKEAFYLTGEEIKYLLYLFSITIIYKEFQIKF